MEEQVAGIEESINAESRVEQEVGDRFSTSAAKKSSDNLEDTVIADEESSEYWR